MDHLLVWVPHLSAQYLLAFRAKTLQISHEESRPRCCSSFVTFLMIQGSLNGSLIHLAGDSSRSMKMTTRSLPESARSTNLFLRQIPQVEKCVTKEAPMHNRVTGGF